MKALVGLLLLAALPPRAARAGVAPPPGPRSELLRHESDSRERLDCFAAKLDALLRRQQSEGIYPEAFSFGFALEGHGIVFLSRAVRSPLGAPAAYLRLLGEPAASGSALVMEKPSGSAYLPIERLTEKARIAREEADLRRARRRLQILSQELRSLRDLPDPTPHLEIATDRAPAAVVLNWTAELTRRQIALARIETEVASLGARLEEAEGIQGYPRGQDAPSAAPPRDPLDRIAESVVDLVLQEGRALASHRDDRISIVLLVRPVGEEKPDSVLQFNAAGADLPASQDPTAVEAARKKVVVTKSPR